jgi:hypothetical protein
MVVNGLQTAVDAGDFALLFFTRSKLYLRHYQSLHLIESPVRKVRSYKSWDFLDLILYLSDRYPSVTLRGVSSTPKPLWYSIPQGFYLAPSFTSCILRQFKALLISPARLWGVSSTTKPFRYGVPQELAIGPHPLHPVHLCQFTTLLISTTFWLWLCTFKTWGSFPILPSNSVLFLGAELDSQLSSIHKSPNFRHL